VQPAECAPANDADGCVSSTNEGSVIGCIVFHMRILDEEGMGDLDRPQAPAAELAAINGGHGQWLS
jgi:hypothetical protein